MDESEIDASWTAIAARAVVFFVIGWSASLCTGSVGLSALLSFRLVGGL